MYIYNTATQVLKAFNDANVYLRKNPDFKIFLVNSTQGLMDEWGCFCLDNISIKEFLNTFYSAKKIFEDFENEEIRGLKND